MFYVKSQNPDQHGIPLAWIIDNSCVHSMALTRNYANIFLNNDKVIDITDSSTPSGKLLIRFFKDNNIIEDLEVSEKFGSILLSNPTVINLMFHKFGYLVDDNEFNFVDYDIDPGQAWQKFETGFYDDKAPVDPSIKCYNSCGCEMCIGSCLCGWSN